MATSQGTDDNTLLANPPAYRSINQNGVEPPHQYPYQPYGHGVQGVQGTRTDVSGQIQVPYRQTTVMSSHTLLLPPDQNQNINSHLGLSIFACLCCCWPLGLAAIIFSTRANDQKGSGNWDAARESARTALSLAGSAIGIGIALMVVIGILFATGVIHTTQNPY